MPHHLHRIHMQRNARLAAQGTDALDGLQRPHLALSPDHGHQPRGGNQQPLQLLQIHHPLLIHGQRLHLPSRPLQLLSCSQGGGVLHAGNQQARVRSKRLGHAQQGQVDCLCAPGGEHHPAGLTTEQLTKPLPLALQLLGGLQPESMQAGGVRPGVLLTGLHRLLHRRGQGRGGAAVEIAARVEPHGVGLGHPLQRFSPGSRSKRARVRDSSELVAMFTRSSREVP